MENTKRTILFTVEVAADDHDNSPLSDTAYFSEEAIIDAISSEGWEVKNIKSKIYTGKVVTYERL